MEWMNKKAEEDEKVVLAEVTITMKPLTLKVLGGDKKEIVKEMENIDYLWHQLEVLSNENFKIEYKEIKRGTFDELDGQEDLTTPFGG